MYDVQIQNKIDDQKQYIKTIFNLTKTVTLSRFEIKKN